MNWLFAADCISKRFGQRAVLSNASVWGSAGRITALLGRNGCGKTTLLRIAAGLLRADAGTVRFDGEVRERPRLDWLARRGLFYLPAGDLLPWQLTLRQSLTWIERAWQTRSDAAVAALGLEHLLDRLPSELSGGEARRAALAVVLARAPRCLLADEPFLGLSPIDAERIAHAFRRLAADGCATILTGHEVPVLLELADEVVWLTSGTTRLLGTPAAARRNDHFMREYLGCRPA